MLLYLLFQINAMSGKGSNDGDIAPSFTSPGSKIPVPVILPSSKKHKETVKEGTLQYCSTTPQMDDTAGFWMK